MCRRMEHTHETSINEEEATLRGLLKLQFGIAETANPLGEAARLAGYKNEWNLALAALVGRVGETRVAQRERIAKNTRERKRKNGLPVEETEADKKIHDDELLLVLSALLEDSPEVVGVRGPEWYRHLLVAFEDLGGTMEMTKDGFYARVAKLVANGKVRSSQSKMPTKLYGRDVLMNVTLYSLPPEEATPAKIGGAS